MKPISPRLLFAAVVAVQINWPAASQGQIVFTNHATVSPFSFTVPLGTGAVGNIKTNTSRPGSYTVTGGGNEIGGTSDEFTFHFLEASATGAYNDYRARVASLEPNATWTKAGFMVRDGSLTNAASVTSTDRMAYCFVTPSGATLDGGAGAATFAFMSRATNSMTANLRINANLAFPAPAYPNARLRLVTWSNFLQGYTSTDGSNWVLIAGWDPLDHPFYMFQAKVAFGIAVSRGSTGPLPTATAEFRDLTSIGPYPPTVAHFPNFSFAENTSLTILFPVGDFENVNNLTLSATSSNPCLPYDTNHFTFGGSGANRTLTLRPTTNQFGSGYIMVRVSDGTNSASASFFVDVRFVNQNPTISGATSSTISEDNVAVSSVTVSDFEQGRANLTLSATSTNSALLPTNNIVFGPVNPTNGVASFTMTPLSNMFGTTLVRAIVTDTNGGSGTNTFVLTVMPVNDPPTIDPVVIRPRVKTDPPQVIPLTGITSGPANEPQGSLLITRFIVTPALLSPVSVVYAAPQTTGTLNFTLVSSAVTTPVTNASMYLVLNDQAAPNNFTTSSVPVEIHSTNWLPTLSASLTNLTLLEDGQTNIVLTFWDSETAPASLQLSASNSNPDCLSSNGIVFGTLQTEGPNSLVTVTLKPLSEAFGDNVITFTVRDAHGSNSTVVLNLTVNSVNDPPTLDPIHNMTIVQDTGSHTNFVTGISAGPPNEQQTPLTATVMNSTPGLLASVEFHYATTLPNGYFVVAPESGQIGSSTVTVELEDGSGSRLTNSFTVTVLSTNDVARVGQGSADYLNRIYFPSNPPSVSQAPAVAYFGGFVAAPLIARFSPAASYPAGPTPHSVTTADVNGDGRVDLVTANQGGFTLTVSTNDGNGSFAISSSPMVGGHPISVTAADVNGDGKADLISANYDSNSLTVLTNDGSGRFVISSSPTVGAYPISVTSADVNGDSKADLISANFTANSLTVLINNGTGGFVSSSSHPVGFLPISVIAADINHDGKLDLISANNGANTLTVLLNGLNGSFTLSASPAVGSAPFSVVAADVNADGFRDLISASYLNGTLSVLTNSGTGGFALASSPTVGTQPYSVVAADVNGDGKPDLISANSFDGTLSVLTNNGTGAFGLAASPTVGAQPYSVALADVNRDGKTDLLSANFGAGTVSVLLSKPSSWSAFGQPFAGNIVGLPYIQLGGSFDLGSLGTPVSWPDNAAFYIPQTNGMPDMLFASQPGLLTITFTNSFGLLTRTFYVLDQPAMGLEPATMYLTDIAGVPTGAPEVWITNNLNVIPHYNSTVTSNVLAASSVPGGVKLRAADIRGSIVLEHRDKLSGMFSNVQVLLVKDYRSDFLTTTSTIPAWGSNNWLRPIALATNHGIHPFVSRGLLPTGASGTHFAFQYDNGPTDTNSGKVFVTQPNSDPSQVELFWFKRGYGNIVWPDEMARYAAQWPDGWQTSPATMRIYLTKTDDGADTVAPGVDLPTLAVPNVTIHYNAGIPSQFLFDGATNGTIYLESGTRKVQARHYTGPILLHYNESPPGSFLGFQLVWVKPYSPDTITDALLGQRLLPVNPINDVANGAPKPFVARGAPPDNPAHVYQHAPDSADPGTQDGHVFAIRTNAEPTKVEVFWKNRGLREVEWAAEMIRYRLNWPTPSVGSTKYVAYARGPASFRGAPVSIPVENHAQLMPFQEPSGHAQLSGNLFSTTQTPGWALLRYSRSNDVAFQVVRSLDHFQRDDSSVPLAGVYQVPVINDIGVELSPQSGPTNFPGYIYLPTADRHSWDRYDWEIYDGKPDDPPEFRTRQIFAVHPGQLEVWWFTTNTYDVGWPSRVWIYTNQWPAVSQKIVIASGEGSGPLSNSWANPRIYYQNDPSLVGFNPNDEHALILPSNGGGGQAVFALRSDLGSDSAPFVLLKYRQGSLWNYNVRGVLPVQGTNDFRYDLEAGFLIQPPYPLPVISLPIPRENTNFDGFAWRDRKDFYWAPSAGNDGVSHKDIRMGFHYPVQDGFYFPDSYFPRLTSLGIAATNLPQAGTRVPWLDLLAGTPTIPHTNIYEIFWGPDTPTLRVGETLVKSKFGLPEIGSMISAQIIYQQSEALGQGKSALLIDPTRVRTNFLGKRIENLNPVPTTVTENGLVYFPTLPPHLRSRFWYDPATTNLNLRGQWVDGIGIVEPKGYLLLNMLTAGDRTNHLYALTSDVQFRSKVDALATDIIEVQTNTPFDSLALTAGRAKVTGYVTIAENNSTNLNRPEDPVSLHIIRVDCPVYQGEIKIVESDHPFDEKLTLRHTGDFAGKADEYKFEWRYVRDSNGEPEVDPPLGAGSPATNWIAFGSSDGLPGAQEITIAGPGLVTLSDNWFITRYRRIAVTGIWPCTNAWSDWTPPQLAEGWIKRVLAKINPFEQRLQDYRNSQVNSIVSMISQAGARYTGDIPLNGRAANNYGLIEIYETILKRGLGLSIEAGFDYDPANKALLLAAGRLADLYMLLGNEAYADASDPTIAFGTEDSQYGSEATSLHCFMNQTPSLLEEELALLRGRDNALQPSVLTFPFYNRLIWNFTRDITGGEVAYALNYNIQDLSGNVSSTVDEATARGLYPQGHGDAWGHYLTAMKNYYRLLTHTNYTWTPQAEAVTVLEQPVTVDYYDERKFARAAAAKARTGAEIVNLTYRQSYVESQDDQWLDQPDANAGRAWSVGEWACRAGQGALFDWVMANALLPPVSTLTGVQKIDRTTVAELREIPAVYGEIQAQVDNADAGLNPLGVAQNAIPFDIDPRGITDNQGQTHFEQIYSRATLAMNNAVTVFNHANNSTQLLRRQADSLMDFQRNVLDREVDFTNRLIETFGYPYADDIGPGATYSQGYSGPDLVHFFYIEVDDITGVPAPSTVVVTQRVYNVDVDVNGVLFRTTNNVAYNLHPDFHGFVKPANWRHQRRAPGEVQRALGELLQARTRLLRSLQDYNNLHRQIEDQVELLRIQFSVNAAEIDLLNVANGQQQNLNGRIRTIRATQFGLRTAAVIANLIADAYAEMLPTSVGFSVDPTSAARGTIKLAAAIVSQELNIVADGLSLDELALQQAKEEARDTSNIELTTLRQIPGIANQLAQLRQLVRQEPGLRLDLYNQRQAIIAAAGAYQSALARGDRLLEDRLRFRQETAATIQNYRYKDMAFRIFRNDALQKYRAQFDMAARYVHLAAKAYDYETCLQPWDARGPGEHFLTDIIRSRDLGLMQNGQPIHGSGTSLADALARMWQNWSLVLRSQLGFNNPQTEAGRFSLRTELFRTQTNTTDSRVIWRQMLSSCVVSNLLAIPEFKRYCIPFSGTNVGSAEPGLVIPFSTTVNFGQNFFGWPLGGGDSSYDSSHFATKVRGVGVWFANYNSLSLSYTPRIYLVPVGDDMLRSPTGNYGITRNFTVVDQLLPVPYLNPSALQDPNWIPINETLDGNLADIRRFPSFRAYHDGGFTTSEMIYDTRLIGRSVWNTRWLLIIPSGTLYYDPSNRREGLDRFINGLLVGGVRDGNGVSDIKLFFQTYSYSGN